ncbi:hypothetical protein R3P38DRAFT_628598 [Favolaschia claudopus]|uniref:Uncharacterized protein n=1 Tax=Favolaschia claudopus TaxID=2862362 RepID=A0AAV9Z644_9AGAR
MPSIQNPPSSSFDAQVDVIFHFKISSSYRSTQRTLSSNSRTKFPYFPCKTSNMALVPLLLSGISNTCPQSTTFSSTNAIFLQLQIAVISMSSTLEFPICGISSLFLCMCPLSPSSPRPGSSHPAAERAAASAELIVEFILYTGAVDEGEGVYLSSSEGASTITAAARGGRGGSDLRSVTAGLRQKLEPPTSPPQHNMPPNAWPACEVHVSSPSFLASSHWRPHSNSTSTIGAR